MAEGRELNELDDLIEYLSGKVEDITIRAANGEITVLEWENAMRDLIKRSHVAVAEMARGDAQLNIIQRGIAWFRRELNIRREFSYLRKFTLEIISGRYNGLSSIGSLMARARMYANAARQTGSFESRQIAIMKGATQKRRVLEPGAKHCDDCRNQADLGWVDINSYEVTDIGQTQCRSSDRCEIEYQ